MKSPNQKRTSFGKNEIRIIRKTEYKFNTSPANIKECKIINLKSPRHSKIDLEEFKKFQTLTREAFLQKFNRFFSKILCFFCFRKKTVNSAKITPLTKLNSNKNFDDNKVKGFFGLKQRDKTPKQKSLKALNYLWINNYVKKFVSILKYKVMNRNLQKLDIFHQNIIDDPTFFKQLTISRKTQLNNPVYNLTKDHLREFKSRLRKALENVNSKFFEGLTIINEKIPIFGQTNLILMIWSSIFLLVMAINVILTPFKITFGTQIFDDSEINKFMIDGIQSFSYIIHILITINTEYYSKGVFVKQRWKIIKNYFKTKFLFDAVCLGSLFFSYNQKELGSYYIIECLLLFRVYFVNNLITKFYDFLQLRSKLQGILNLFKLILLICYLTHISGCGWIIFGNMEFKKGSISWMQSLKIDNEPWNVKYINAVYFSIVTMATVGYGDISPQNIYEKSWSIFMIILSCGVYAYSLNSVGIILNEMYREEKELKLNISNVNNYMNKRNISPHLQTKVRKYLEYMYTENKSNSSQIFAHLSKKLKEEVLIETYGQILKDNSFLSTNFSEGFLNKLCLKMKESNYAPGDLIIKNNNEEINEKTLYFILNGSVECFFQKKFNHDVQDIPLAKYHKGDFIGEISFVSGVSNSLNYKTLTASQICYITLTDFLITIKDFVEDYEIFCELKDNYNIYENFSIFKKKCNSCGDENHDTSKCYIICPFFNNEKIAQDYIKENFQLRSLYSRRKSKINCLSKYNYLIQRYEIFKDTNEEKCDVFIEKVESEQDKMSQSMIPYLLDGSASISSLNSAQFKKKIIMAESSLSNIDEDEKDNKKDLLLVNDNITSFDKIDKSSAKLPKFSRNKLRINTRIYSNKPSLQKSPENLEILQNNLENTRTPNDNYLFLNFEIMKNYKNYFPHNNVDRLLKFLNIGFMNFNLSLQQKKKIKVLQYKNINSRTNIRSSTIEYMKDKSRSNSNSNNSISKEEINDENNKKNHSFSPKNNLSPLIIQKETRRKSSIFNMLKKIPHDQ